MSKGSEAVKRWRENTKKRIIESLGGKCVICDYDRFYKALACHHLDPSKKDLCLGGSTSHPQSWARIVEELRKCVLLCHNCHEEVHGGLVDVPEDAARFNESFAEYRLTREMDPCPICGKPKFISYKTCSNVCSGKRGRIVDWDSVDLPRELESKSYTEIGLELGVTSVAVSKRAKKLGLRY